MSVAVAIRPSSEIARDPPPHRRAEYELPVSWIGQTLRTAALDGINLADPMSASGVSLRDASVRDAGLDPAECMLLCMLLVNAVDDELHGLTRSRMSRGTASMGARATLSARTLEGAINTLCRFYDMIGGTCRFSLRRTADQAVLTIRTDRGDKGQRALIEELLAHTVHMQFSYFFGALLPLTRFVTPVPHHPAMDRRHPYLLCPVAVGPNTSLVFPAALLTAQSRAVAVDHPLWEAGRFWLARHPATGNPITGDDSERPVSAALLGVLMREDISIADCSAELAFSLLDLRRDLASEGTSFRQIRRTALIERARPRLAEGGSIDDLAASLGYSDARSFRRALKLATGLGISELRRDAVVPAAERTELMARLRQEMLRLE